MKETRSQKEERMIGREKMKRKEGGEEAESLVSSQPVRLICSARRGQRRTKEVKEGETEEGGEEDD